MDKVTELKEQIMKTAKEKKNDPYKMTKLVGATNAVGIPGDMAFDYLVEGIDQFKHRNKALHGNNLIKVFTSPEVKQHFKRFGMRQSGSALPLSVAVAGAMTAPVFLAEYNANKHKTAEEIVDEVFEKTAKKKSMFQKLKDNEVPLTSEEKAVVRAKKAIWSGGQSAVWKSVGKDGKTTYITHTHRAYNTAPTLKGAIGRFHGFIKSTASEVVEEGFEKIAKEQVLFHASPVQDIKKFRKSEDTSGNNKGEIIFATPQKGFAGAFGTRWHDGIASLSTSKKSGAEGKVTDSTFDKATLKVTKDVDLNAPASLYQLKGDFQDLRYPNDIEKYTNKDVKIISEQKFNSYRDLAKACGVEIKKVSPKYIEKKLETRKSIEPTEKTASEKDDKIPELEEAFKDNPLAKKVAYMIATSHEYKKPNVDAALSFVKNYKWELTTCKLNDMQGINKPVDEAKVADMAKNMKTVKPFIVVNQFHGIRPQTPGKKILIDGHHRMHACIAQGRTEVDVYKGTYTGEAEKTTEELKGVGVGNKEFDKKKTYAVDFDGTIVTNAFPKIGEPKEKVIKLIRKIHTAGGTIVIWTCRSGQVLADAIKWLKDNNVPYDYVNENPKGEFGSRKVYADYYIDDRAISVDDIDNGKVAAYKEYVLEKTANLLTHKDTVTNIPGKNITLVTGYSGSGKTTLGEQLEKQSPNNVFIELDGFESGFYDTTGEHKVVDNFIKKNGPITAENYEHMLPAILRHIENEAESHPNNHYYVDGIQLLDTPSLFEKYPSIIKGTGLIKSSIRKFNRPGNTRSLMENIKFNARFNKDLNDVNKIVKDKTSAYVNYTMEKMAMAQKVSTDTHLNRIKRAGTNKRMIHMSYTDKKGETTERLVEPYEIRDEDLWAYDPAKESIRRFKLGQINKVKVTDVKFNPKWDIKVGEYTPKTRTKKIEGQLNLFDNIGGTKDEKNTKETL